VTDLVQNNIKRYYSSERGRDSSIETKLIPFFLTTHMMKKLMKQQKRKIKDWQVPQHSIKHAELVMAISIILHTIKVHKIS